MRCTHMLRNGFCGLCLANRRGRANYKGHVGFRKPRSRRCFDAMGLHKRQMVPGAGQVLPLQPACRLAQGYPSLWEFLSATVWPDSDPPEARQTGTITIFAEDGWVKVFLNDRAQSLQHCVTGATLSEALTEADDAVAADATPWRPVKPKPAGGRRA